MNEHGRYVNDSKLLGLIADKDLVQAIKRLRELTRMDLARCKEIVQRLMEDVDLAGKVKARNHALIINLVERHGDLMTRSEKEAIEYFLNK